MAVCDRRIDGLSHQEISAQLCISLGMVMRYSKHIDLARLAREANKSALDSKKVAFSIVKSEFSDSKSLKESTHLR
jgi:hypothetical protein